MLYKAGVGENWGQKSIFVKGKPSTCHINYFSSVQKKLFHLEYALFRADTTVEKYHDV